MIKVKTIEQKLILSPLITIMKSNIDIFRWDFKYVMMI